tara:strand:+ start:152 stop:358 length:207 start_codon:yes stop_codon:yes gene_type:complete
MTFFEKPAGVLTEELTPEAMSQLKVLWYETHGKVGDERIKLVIEAFIKLRGRPLKEETKNEIRLLLEA